MTRVVIAGVSTRAAAASAARAGFTVTAVDGYADRDQDPRVHAISLPRDRGLAFTARAAVTAAADVNADAAVYLSNIDNDVAAVATLATGRSLWGNPPEVLRHARDPLAVARLLRESGIPAPRVAATASDATDGPSWLLKPRSSGGGNGVRIWRGQTPVRPTHYLQERIAGTPGSVVFVAANGHATPLAMSRQLIGDRRFGASGFRYCGNILAPVGDPQFARPDELATVAYRLVAVTAAGLTLVGVNGIDFIADTGIPYPLEINPRWTASLELVERVCATNVFAAHAAACAAGTAAVAVTPPAHAAGKAIVFARHAAIAGDTDAWLADPDIRDVPHAGDVVAASAPICTVLAEAADAAACEAELVRRAARIHADVATWSAPDHLPRPSFTDSRSA